MQAKTAPPKHRERTPIAAPIVTDATAPTLLGMSPRQFREAVARQRVPYMKLGQRMIVFFAESTKQPCRPSVAGHRARRLSAVRASLPARALKRGAAVLAGARHGCRRARSIQ